MKATVQHHPVDDGMVAFSDLEAGDFIVADTGNIGMKLDSGGIVWVTGGARGKETLRGNMTYGKRYLQPVSVVVTL